MNAFRRHGPVWIVGRIGILICFGIMPIFRMCDMAKRAPMREAYTKCMSAYSEANKYPVLSEGWNTNIAAAHYWDAEGAKLYEKLYGKRP